MKKVSLDIPRVSMPDDYLLLTVVLLGCCRLTNSTSSDTKAQSHRHPCGCITSDRRQQAASTRSPRMDRQFEEI